MNWEKGLWVPCNLGVFYFLEKWPPQRPGSRVCAAIGLADHPMPDPPDSGEEYMTLYR
jgi:hypothetical protein